MKTTICVLVASLYLHLTFAFGVEAPQAEDPRFANGTSRIKNSYMEGMTDAVLKAFDRKDWSLCSFKGVQKVGGSYVVSGSIALNGVKEPVTEKDFDRLKTFFEPFIKEQENVIQQKGGKITSRVNSFPLPSSAQGYTKNELPTMKYRLTGEKDDLFWLQITFSDRRDDYLVVEFTIVAVP